MAGHLRARRGGFRGRYYSPPVYIEPVPTAPCCACCGNVSNDPTCRACAVRNVGELGAPEPSPAAPAAAGVPPQAQGYGAGAIIIGLGLYFALKKD